jgi:hypothetical protein
MSGFIEVLRLSLQRVFPYTITGRHRSSPMAAMDRGLIESIDSHARYGEARGKQFLRPE